MIHMSFGVTKKNSLINVSRCIPNPIHASIYFFVCSAHLSDVPSLIFDTRFRCFVARANERLYVFVCLCVCISADFFGWGGGAGGRRPSRGGVRWVGVGWRISEDGGITRIF